MVAVQRHQRSLIPQQFMKNKRVVNGYATAQQQALGCMLIGQFQIIAQYMVVLEF